MRNLILTSLIVPLVVAASLLFCWKQKEGESERSLWVREDLETLSQSGTIHQGDLDSFRSVFDEHVKYVIVDSRGGDVDEAVQIGMILRKAHITVIVRGLCLSSCANYFFTAGETRIIDDGLVGFHGNASALTARYGGAEQLLESRMPFWMQWFISEENTQEEIRKIRQTIRREKEFFAALGISQALFTVSQLPDKGKGNQRQYTFLLPTASTFAKYGIRHVQGSQNVALKKKLEKEFSMRFLHE